MPKFDVPTTASPPPVDPSASSAPATARNDRRGWGWLVVAGGVAFAAGALLPWISLGSGAFTLTLSGIDLAKLAGTFANHGYLVVVAGLAIAALGILIVNGQNAWWPAAGLAGLATLASIWEMTNVSGGQSRLTGGDTVSVGFGLFLMLGGGLMALAGGAIPALDRAAKSVG
jgi:hypothetical protein